MKEMSNPVNIASHKATSQTEAEVIYTALTGGKLPLNFVSYFPLSQILLDLRKIGFQSVSSSVEFTSFIEIRNRGETSLDWKSLKTDDYGFSLPSNLLALDSSSSINIENTNSPNSDQYSDKIIDNFYQTFILYDLRNSHGSHAENLIKIAPHMRFISTESLDLDGILTTANGMGISSLLAGPLFQQCLNPSSASDCSPVGAPWSTGKYNKKNQRAVMDPGVASFLSQIVNRQIASEIASFVAALAHELPLEEFASLENTLLTKIFSLVNSKSSSADRIAGVSVILMHLSYKGFYFSPSCLHNLSFLKCSDRPDFCY
jgi:hypothetical protein